MSISAETVRVLREQTGAGLMDCKKALQETAGDLEKAKDYLRTKGLAAAAKKSGRKASEGLVGSYIHMGGRLGVMVEVNCETDFVARTSDFQNFVRDLAMHVAGAPTVPVAVRREEMDPKLVEHEREIARAQAKEQGKPEKIWDKIVQGKVDKFYKDHCLLEQVFVKDPEGRKTIQDLLTETISKLGENIVIRRFARFELGQKLGGESNGEASE